LCVDRGFHLLIAGFLFQLIGLPKPIGVAIKHQPQLSHYSLYRLLQKAIIAESSLIEVHRGSVELPQFYTHLYGCFDLPFLLSWPDRSLNECCEVYLLIRTLKWLDIYDWYAYVYTGASQVIRKGPPSCPPS